MLGTALPDSGRINALKKTGSIKRLQEADLVNLKSIFDEKTAKNIFKEVRAENQNAEEFVKRIIPIRFDAEGGNAKDLEPVNYRLAS